MDGVVNLSPWGEWSIEEVQIVNISHIWPVMVRNSTKRKLGFGTNRELPTNINHQFEMLMPGLTLQMTDWSSKIMFGQNRFCESTSHENVRPIVYAMVNWLVPPIITFSSANQISSDWSGANFQSGLYWQYIFRIWPILRWKIERVYSIF
jgi:hypothetical protein